MVPDLAPDEGEQPPPQLPPHVIVTVDAAPAYLPASQSVQDVDDEEAKYLPALQYEQELDEDADEYLPASQGMHPEVAGGVYVPAGQEQEVDDETEVMPEGQFVHVLEDVAPQEVENFPAAQPAQVSELLDPEYFPAGHCVQWDDDDGE